MLRSSDDELHRENKVEQEVEQEQSKPIHRPKLEDFVRKGQDLYEAMEFFILASPKRQALQDGSSASLRKQGDEARQAGNNILARINYESAAKLALYEQDRESLKTLLEMADEVTKVERFKNYHHVLLRNLDQVMKIAKDYYAAFDSANEPSETTSSSQGDSASSSSGGRSVMTGLKN